MLSEYQEFSNIPVIFLHEFALRNSGAWDIGEINFVSREYFINLGTVQLSSVKFMAGDLLLENVPGESSGNGIDDSILTLRKIIRDKEEKYRPR